MAIRNIRYEKDEILRKISKPVKEVNHRIITLLDDMADTMRERNGVGLAAPQVGVLKRVVVIQISDEDELYELINPVIIETKGEQTKSEGCLSIPGESGFVTRPEYIKIRAKNRDFEEFELEGEGYLAVAISHELDHLDGILYIDKVVEMDEEPEDEEDDFLE